MKNKGISLIVLIITIVVIVILATAIIVNLAQTNIIGNANEATVKQDFKTMQEELNLYIADEFANTRGQFKAQDLNISVKSEVEKIIISIKGSKYVDYVIIENGKLSIVDTMPEPEKTWAMEALGLTNTTTNVPTVDTIAPTNPTNLELTAVENSILAKANGSTDDNSFVYEYSIDNSNWQQEEEIKNLESVTEYTVYARAIDTAGNTSASIDKTITTNYNISDVNEIVVGGNALSMGDAPAYNNPIIPVGFKAKETSDATWTDGNGDSKPDGWNNGLVIVDGIGNEFVWVPVDGSTITYDKWNSTSTAYGTLPRDAIDDTSVLPVVNESVIDENTQISKYHGFYVGRYEAGVPLNQSTITGENDSSNTIGIPTVMKDSMVWSYISYENASSSALSFCNTNYVKSSIVTGKQWDTICEWIQSEKVNNSVLHNCTTSTSWGNYNDTTGDAQNNDSGDKISGIRWTAGYSEKWKAKNIYDIAGNVWEWGAEIRSADHSYHIIRGGGYGSTSRAAYYRGSEKSFVDAIGFRIVLYVM